MLSRFGHSPIKTATAFGRRRSVPVMAALLTPTVICSSIGTPQKHRFLGGNIRKSHLYRIS